MWKPVALVALALSLEGAFILNAAVPDAVAMRRAGEELRPRPAAVAVAEVAPAAPAPISAGAIARAR
jgi:hypothetical protein